MLSIDKLFDTLEGSFHDGALLDALYTDGTLYVHCFRWPFYGSTLPIDQYIIARFDGVSDLCFYDIETRTFRPYEERDFIKPKDYALCLTDYLDYEEDYVVFGQALRFRCEDVTLLEHSAAPLDFEKYKK